MFKPEMFAKPEWATDRNTGDEEWRVTLRNFGKGLVWVLIVTAGLVAACFYFIWILITAAFKVGNS
jgi:hypothetical protein